ncbi:MAG: cysteine hydrolase family protein [Mycobacterium leprae]
MDRSKFLSQSMTAVGEMLDTIGALPPGKLADLPADKTALVIVDMVNGFVTEGPLSSPRVAGLIPAIVKLQQAMVERQMPIIVFGDCHEPNSVEFEAYPPHCMAFSNESKVIPEIEAVGGYRRFPKRSTNGYLEPAFQAWLAENPTITNFVLVGDCTDICILQLATTLKTHFNVNGKRSRIIVPVDAVETFDAPGHHGDLLHLFALINMRGNAIDLVSTLQ